MFGHVCGDIPNLGLKNSLFLRPIYGRYLSIGSCMAIGWLDGYRMGPYGAPSRWRSTVNSLVYGRYNYIQLWPWLLVITGYFSGKKKHSIHVVFLVLITGMTRALTV